MEVYCHCGVKAVMLTSWTEFNPGRRFWTCGNRLHPCGFFLWFDPPMCHRAVEIIPGLIRRIREYEAVKIDGGNQRRQGSTWKFLWVCILVAWVILAWLILAWIIFGDEGSSDDSRKFPAISGQ